MSTLGQRIKTARGKASQAAFADLIGISKGSLGFYERNENRPNTDVILKICSATGFSVHWLMTGEGAAHLDGAGRQPVPDNDWQPAIEYKQPQHDDPWKSTKWQSVPLIGLANCGDAGWYTAEQLAVRVDLPIDYPYTMDMFAVLAVGTSMQPEGIRQGFVAFCNPSASIEAGDAVYIEKKDRTSAIKKYLKTDHDTVHVQGWMAPDKDGVQKPYFQEIRLSDIKCMSCIVIVKRKA